MNETIKVDSVFLNFGSVAVLRGANLEFVRNQVTGVLGRNGSGKSCLLKIITGQIIPQSKYIKYKERQLSDLYKERRLINYLPQHEFHPKSVVLKQLLKFYEIDQDYFLNEYTFFKESINRKFSSISGGERRMFEVLLVLEAKTKFSILDEPFSHVMPKYIDLLKDRILKLKANKGILITDHQYQNVMEVSDKLYLLSSGVMQKVEQEEDLQFYGYIR